MNEKNDIRKTKGIQIAETSRIMRRERGGYVVPSQSGDGVYIVKYVNYRAMCECPDYKVRQMKCKHIWAVEVILNKKQYQDGSVEITQTIRKTYGQDWSAYNRAQRSEKALFMELLADLCSSIGSPAYKFGRPTLAFSDMIFCAVFKTYSTFSGRRFSTDMQTAKEKDYIDRVPHFNSVFNYLQKEELTPILKELIEMSALPLKSVETVFAVDSSGFSTRRYKRWFDFKYGKEKDVRIWLKAHLITGVKTNIVTGTEITEAYSHDSKEFGKLVNLTARRFNVEEVSADKAYSSRTNMEIVNEIGGIPFIPYKSNTTGKAKGSLLWKKMYHYFMFQRDEFLDHYHKRSNVETAFHMIKAKFGTQIRSKTKTAEINEVLCKILAHNICVLIQEMHELGIEPIFSAQKVGEN